MRTNERQNVLKLYFFGANTFFSANFGSVKTAHCSTCYAQKYKAILNWVFYQSALLEYILFEATYDN